MYVYKYCVQEARAWTISQSGRARKKPKENTRNNASRRAKLDEMKGWLQKWDMHVFSYLCVCFEVWTNTKKKNIRIMVNERFMGNERQTSEFFSSLFFGVFFFYLKMFFSCKLLCELPSWPILYIHTGKQSHHTLKHTRAHTNIKMNDDDENEKSRPNQNDKVGIKDDISSAPPNSSSKVC